MSHQDDPATHPPRPPANPLRPRHLRLWMEIADAAGQQTGYAVAPLTFAPPSAVHKAYTLTKFKGLEPREAYQCVMDTEGNRTCTCLGFTHTQHCKHLEALQAAGLLVAADLLHIRGLKLELEGRMEVIRKGLPEKKASRGAKAAHARRIREECERVTSNGEPVPAQA